MAAAAAKDNNAALSVLEMRVAMAQEENKTLHKEHAGQLEVLDERRVSLQHEQACISLHTHLYTHTCIDTYGHKCVCVCL